jgi:hypothetical protein
MNLEAPVLIMLTQEREITQVAPIVVVVIAAWVVKRHPKLLVVRLPEEAKIRKIDNTVSVDVRADYYDINADRNCTSSNIQESLTLARNIHTTSKDTATGCHTTGERSTSSGACQRIGSYGARAEAELLPSVTGIHPVIRPGNTSDTNASRILYFDPDIICVAAATVTDEFEVASRTGRYSQRTTRSGFTKTLIHVTGVKGGRENQQQREKQDFSFEHRVNLLNLLKGLGP